MKILHPTDFSKTAEKARVLALDLHAKLPGGFHVVHVQEDYSTSNQPFVSMTIDGLSGELRQRFEEARQEEVKQLRERLAFLTPEGGSSELIWGKPIRELLAILPSHDLVVMGAHGANLLDSYFVGGVAGRLVRRSPTPILTVRESCQQTVVKRVLVATDFGEASKNAWEWCQQLRDAGIKLVAAHVIDSQRLQDDIGYQQVVTEALGFFAKDQAERQVLREGNPVDVLPKLAEELEADAIVIGVRQHSGALGLLLGSRADGLIRASSVPVLSVPHVT